MIDIVKLKAEARRILIEYSNGVVWSRAFGQKNTRRLLSDDMRVHYIYAMLDSVWEHDDSPIPPVSLPLVLTWEDINVTPVTDPYSLEEWNEYFDLPNYGSPFTSIVVEGNVVSLYGGSGITIKEGIFSNSSWYPDDGEIPFTINGFLLSIVDYADCVVETGQYSFAYDPEVDGIESKLHTVILPALETVREGSFAYNKALSVLEATKVVLVENNGFYYCSSVPFFDMPILVSGGDSAFAETTSVQRYYFPEMTYAGKRCMMNMYSDTCTEIDLPLCTGIGNGCFYGNQNVSVIKLPVVQYIGNNAGDGTYLDVFSVVSDDILVDGYVPQYPLVLSGYNDVFKYIDSIDGTIELTINEDMLTVNNGYMDNDVASLMFYCELYRFDPETGGLPRNHYGNKLTIIPV